MDYERITKLIEIKKIPLPILSSELGMTDMGFKTMMKNQTMKVSTLERLCHVLKVSPNELLDCHSDENVLLNIAIAELEKTELRVKQSLDMLRKKSEAHISE